MERVRDLHMRVIRLAKQTGLEHHGETVTTVFENPDFGCVTPDLEAEALAKGMMDAVREIDMMLVSFLEMIKPRGVELTQSIAQLNADLQEKEGFIRMCLEIMVSMKEELRALRDEQIEFLHGQATQTCSLDNDDIVSRIDNGSFGFDAHMDRMDQ
uniref:Uncharacterized protein n=1 Tax=Compsopogon caeruleus TaxID=31354 RepID=A0A7S1XCN1_9RHOD